MPFSLGQIFGSAAIDYGHMSASELDTCLLNSHCCEGDSFPSPTIRNNLSFLLERVRVGKSSSLSDRGGNPNFGMFITKKKRGEIVGIYSGIATSSECSDSLYLFQLDTLTGSPRGKIERSIRVVDGSPNPSDPWTVFGRINEWVWHCEDGAHRNNCEVLPGGTIVATRDIIDEEAFISYGSDYPWFHVKIPLLREIPWTLRKILPKCNAGHFEPYIYDLEGVIIGMSTEAGYRRALRMEGTALEYSLAVYIDGMQPTSVGHLSSVKSSFNTVLDSEIAVLKNVSSRDQLRKLLHSSLPSVTSDESFTSWLFRVLMCDRFFLRHVFRYADHPDIMVALWPDVLLDLPVLRVRPTSRNQSTWQKFFARVIEKGIRPATQVDDMTVGNVPEAVSNAVTINASDLIYSDNMKTVCVGLNEVACEHHNSDCTILETDSMTISMSDDHFPIWDADVVASLLDDCHSFNSCEHSMEAPSKFVPFRKLCYKGSSSSSNLRLRLDFSTSDDDLYVLHDIVRSWQAGGNANDFAKLLGDRLTCEVKVSQNEIKKMTWDPSGWMVLSEVEFKSPSDLTTLGSRLRLMGLTNDVVTQILSAYENDEHVVVDFDSMVVPSLSLSQVIVIWSPEGRKWAHPSVSLEGMDFRNGASLQTILDMVDARHVLCLPKNTSGRHVINGYAYFVHPISAVDVKSALNAVVSKLTVSISEWARLHPPPLLADFDLKLSGMRILSLSDCEGESIASIAPLISPSIGNRINRRRRRKPIEPVLPSETMSDFQKKESDLIVVHLNCGGCNATKLTLLLEMMIAKKADLMCLSDTGEIPGPRNGLESHARHILNRHVSSWGIHTIKAMSPPLGSKTHPPGGALVIFNLSRISRVKLNSVLDYGLLFEVEFNFGALPMIVTSTYFPPRRWGATAGPASIEAQILGLIQAPGNAVDHMKTSLCERLTLATNRNLISIVGGDFNSNSLLDDGYKIELFMNKMDYVNASNSCEKLIPSFCRRALDMIRTSRIDNVFIREDSRVRVMSCAPMPMDFELYDHYPVFTHIRSIKEGIPLYGTRTKRNLPRDIHSTDVISLELFTKQLEEMEIPEDILLCPARLVEWISVTSGAIACSISKCRHSRSCPNHWSVVAIVILVHLRASLLLRRHVATVLNSSTWKRDRKILKKVRHRHLWKQSNYRVNVGRMLHQLNKRLLLIPMTEEDLADCNRLIKYSQSYWESSSLEKLTSEAEDVYLHFRKLLTTRNILDWQTQLRRRRKEMEDELKDNKTGKVHKYHRKYEDKSFTMEEHVIDGEVITDESIIHDHVSKHYSLALSNHLDIPDDALCGVNTTSWRDFELSNEEFRVKASTQGIPTDISDQIWRALQRRPQTACMTAFQESVLIPPSFDEFIDSIKSRPYNSAAAISGCSYNQIKRWPLTWLKLAHVGLCELFEKRQSPDQWKWRYLVLLKKVPNPTLRETRPLMLYEALRKVWWGIFIHRIQIYLKSSQVLCQDQSAYLYGKDTSICSLHILNALETVMEFQSDLFINSWDLEKAFDSVVRPLLIWGGIRIGIPEELMELMVGLDIGGFTVLRSPKVLRFLHKNGMGGLKTSLLYFVATIGTGQGGVEGPLSWNFVIDILLCALRDVKLNDHFFTRDAMGVNREARGRTFADDILSLLASHDSLQKTADVVSAFSILTGIRVSWHKFRCLHVQNSNAGRPSPPSTLSVHTLHWENVNLAPIATSGDLKHLGVVLDVALLNLTQLDKTMDHLIECSDLTSSKSSSTEAKYVHMSRSTLMQMVYYSKYMNWTPSQWISLEKRLNVFYRRLTRNMPSYPSLMLNVHKTHGGLGLQNFLDLVNDNKLRLVFMMMGHSIDTSHDISSLIGRSMNSAGLLCSAVTKCVVEESLDLSEERWWITSLIQYLKSASVLIEKNGVDMNTQQDAGVYPLLDSDRRKMRMAGIFSAGELFMEGDDISILHDISLSAELVASTLSHVTPLGPITLRPGQVWAAHHNESVMEIMGFWYPDALAGAKHFDYDPVDYHVQIIYWKRASSRLFERVKKGQFLSLNDIGGRQSFCTGSGSGEWLPVAEFIQRFDLLLTLSKEVHCETTGSNREGWTSCRIISVRDRTAIGPLLHLDFSTKLPPHMCSAIAGTKRFYSDGSYKSTGTIADMLTGNLKTVAGGAVVSYNEAGSSFLVKIDCSGTDHHSAYSPELLSLGLSIEMAHFIPDRDGLVENFSDCMGAIRTMTRVQKRDFKYSPLSHTVLGLCVRHAASISHVKGHPERYKKRRDWNMNDYGIDLADKVADESVMPDARISDWLVADMLSGAVPFRLVRSDRSHIVDGSLCSKHPGADTVREVTRRCPVFKDIRQLISLARRSTYFEQRQVVHTSSKGCDENLLDVIHMRRFDWRNCCMDVATPMFSLKHLNLTKLAIVNRIILDKHYETNVGKREGFPHQCPLCNDGNLNIFHALQGCSHGVVSHTRYTHTVLMRAAIAGIDGTCFSPGAALLEIIRSNSMAENILRGVVPSELFEQIRGNPHLLVSFEGSTKNKFMKFLSLLGSRSSAVMASFLGSVYESRGDAHSHLSGGKKVLRRADGSLVGRRRKPPNLFTMSQFKPPKKVVPPQVDGLSPLIVEVFSAISPCGSYCISVDYSIKENMIAPQLLIDDLLPGSLLHANLLDKAYTVLMSDARGGCLGDTYGSDIGYSGYAMLHSVLGDQEVIDMADVRRLKEMRVFIGSLRVMTDSIALQEELDCVLSYMKGIVGSWHRSLPESVGLWLGVSEIRTIAGTEDIFIWVYEPGHPMEYVSAERVSLQCLRDMGSMAHVIIHRRMFRKLTHPPQRDIDSLLLSLEDQVMTFLRNHTIKIQPTITSTSSAIV